MLKLHQLVFNPFQVNTYILVDESSHQGIVIDPGMYNANENAIFDQLIEDNNIELTEIVNTHLHIDHCLGNKYVRERYNCPVAASPDDEFLGERIAVQAQYFGLKAPDEIVKSVAINHPLNDGETLEIGTSQIKIIASPGHSPGGIVLYDTQSKVLICGDSLFRGSIGRTDLPGGDFTQLVSSIKNKLLKLPDDTIVYPGHGPMTTIGLEKSTNPYIR